MAHPPPPFHLPSGGGDVSSHLNVFGCGGAVSPPLARGARVSGQGPTAPQPLFVDPDLLNIFGRVAQYSCAYTREVPT